MNRQDLIKCLTQDRDVLKQYNVKSLSVFGSVAREEEKDTSDVDILISFNRSPGLFAFMDLKNHLEDMLGVPVDLVTQQALHPHLRDRIIKESIHVLDSGYFV